MKQNWLKQMKNRSHDKLILGQLNINSLRNKFDPMKKTIGRNVDILLISETKLESHFLQPNLNLMGPVLRLDLIETAKGVGF